MSKFATELLYKNVLLSADIAPLSIIKELGETLEKDVLLIMDILSLASAVPLIVVATVDFI